MTLTGASQMTDVLCLQTQVLIHIEGSARHHRLELRARRRQVEAIRPAIVPALLEGVDLLVRRVSILQIAAVLCLQERKTRIGKARVHGQCHRG